MSGLISSRMRVRDILETCLGKGGLSLLLLMVMSEVMPVRMRKARKILVPM